MLRAQPPTHRPIWMVVLAATMLLSGGLTLVGGLLMVRDPLSVELRALHSVASAPAPEEALKKVEPILREIHERHRVGLRVDAIASIALGLFTLYAVAAVLSRDRNGRRLALLTAVFGIVYQLGELPLSIQMSREFLAAAGPLLAEITSAGGEAAGRSQTGLVATLDAAGARALLSTAVGVGWCALLLVYFGGPRGRELYGLPRRPS